MLFQMSGVLGAPAYTIQGGAGSIQHTVIAHRALGLPAD